MSIVVAPLNVNLQAVDKGGFLQKTFQYWLAALAQAVIALQNRTIINLDSNTALTVPQANSLLLCTGTITLTLPDPTRGRVYFIFNDGVGTITIHGTINGVTNYVLVNPYQYVEVTGDGTQWLVTANN